MAVKKYEEKQKRCESKNTKKWAEKNFQWMKQEIKKTENRQK